MAFSDFLDPAKFTLSAWVKPDGVTGTKVIFEKFEAANAGFAVQHIQRGQVGGLKDFEPGHTVKGFQHTLGQGEEAREAFEAHRSLR